MPLAEMNAELRKAAASALAASILITSPGPWASEAFAQTLRAAPAAPIGAPAELPLGIDAAPLESPAAEIGAIPLPLEGQLPSQEIIGSPVRSPSLRTLPASREREQLGVAALRAAPKVLPRLSGAAKAQSAEAARGSLDAAVAELLGSRVSGASAAPAEDVSAPEAVETLQAAPRADVGLAGRQPRRADLLRGYGKIGLAAGSAVAAGTLLPHAAATVAVSAAGLVASVLLHEVGHLWALRRLGDDTALKHGKFSLNPLKRLDLIGTVALPLASLTVSMTLFGVPLLLGWAKPVPVDFNRLPDPKKDTALASLAGPAVNFAVGALTGLAALALPGGGIRTALASIAGMNLLLGAFNLLPLPNLDGGKVFVAALPDRAYKRWTRNPALPEHAQSIFRRIYQGPANLLTRLHLDHESHGNLAARATTFVALAATYAALYAFLHPPLLFLVLPCSYFYYCIREKTQSQEAVDALVDILDEFASGMAELAEGDDSIKSEVKPELIRTVAGNTLEDAIDKVMASEGFAQLSDDEKFERLLATYKDDLVAALKKDGLSQDDDATIRRMLESEKGKAYFEKLRDWTKKYRIFERWKDPKKKAKDADKKEEKKNDKLSGLGSGFPAAANDNDESAPKPLTFEQALERPEAGINPKERDFLKTFVKEMKQKDGPPVVGRSEEMRKLVKKVTAPRGVPSSVVLVGEAGVGKTAVVEKLAQALRQADENPGSTLELRSMRGRYLLELDANQLLLQEDPVGALSGIVQLLSRLNDPDPRTGNKAILFIDEIHMIFQSKDGERIANLLKKPLRDGTLTLVTATTTKEYKKYMEADDAFKRRLFKIEVGEPTIEEAVRMLEGARSYYEHLLGVRYSDSAQQTAVEASKYDQENHLPAKAFTYWLDAARSQDRDIQLDQLGIKIEETLSRLGYVASVAASRTRDERGKADEGELKDATPIDLYNILVQLTESLASMYVERERLSSGGQALVSDEHVKAEIAEATGIKAGQLTLGAEDNEKYLRMEEELGKDVLGQPEALAAISEAIRRNKANLSDPNRPMGVFFMTGPTGTGKTHLARTLAKFLFSDADAVVRLDMGEYMHDHEVSKLYGSPPGYVGYGQGGQLTEKVRRKPYSVVLFDEIEKAHPAVFDAILQILGEGRLTDGEGRTVDFRNTIVLMTSNLGMGEIDLSKYKRAYQEILETEQKLKKAGQLTPENAAEVARQKKALSEKLMRETRQQAIVNTELAMKERFRPEFKGRIDEVIVFNRISQEIARGIVVLQLKDLARTLAKAGHKLEWDDSAVDRLTAVGFDIELGARPLQGAIRREITGPLAKKILQATAGGASAKTTIRLTAGQEAIELAVSARVEEKPARVEAAEGASRRLFEQVFEKVLRSAATGAAEDWTVQNLDALMRGGASARAAASAGSAEAPKDLSASSGREGDSLFHPDQPAPFGAGTVAIEASHSDASAKDPALRGANKRLDAALAEAGYDEAVREAVTRSLASGEQALGFVKLLTDHAKAFTPAGETGLATLSWSLGPDGLVVSVRRAGGMTAQEREKLEEHFSGAPTAGRKDSFERAERRNLGQQQRGRPADGVQSLYELHRVLSALPGAKLGFSAGEHHSEYWLSLPAPRTDAAAQAADEPAALPAPPSLSKLERSDEVPSPNHFVVKFAPGTPIASARAVIQRHEIVHPFRVLPRDGEGRPLRVLAEFATPGNAAQQAAAVAGEPSVEKVLVHAETLVLLALPAAPAPAAPSGQEFLLAAGPLPHELEPIGEGRPNVHVLTRAQSSGSDPAQHAAFNAFVRAAGLSRNEDEDLRAVRATAYHFLTSAADFMKSRPGTAAVKVSWTLDGPIRLAVSSSDPMEDSDAVILGALLAGNRQLVEAARRSGATIRCSSQPWASVWIEIPRPGSRAGPPPSEPPQASSSRPAPQGPAAFSGAALERKRAQFKTFLIRLIRQGSERGDTIRDEAAEALGDLATADDLALARDWIRMEHPSGHFDKLGAAALILSRFGTDGDVVHIIDAGARYQPSSSHVLNPTRDMLSEALARRLVRKPLGELRQRYGEERDREGGRNDVAVEALWRALARVGDASDARTLKEKLNKTRVAEYYAFLARTDPGELDNLARAWRNGASSLTDEEKGLAYLRVGEAGTGEDLSRLKALVSQQHVGYVDLMSLETRARAFSRLVLNQSAYGFVAQDVQRWLANDLSESSNFCETFAAVLTAGLAGGETELRLLETLMRVDPASYRLVDNYHEMTQHEAAIAWARIAVRTGLIREFMTQPRDAQGRPQPSRIELMLRDRNSLFNLAAVEAMRMLLMREPPPAPPGPEVPSHEAL
jgi:ATP-dependent Clp protease ATP-binding subunit ClpC